MSVASLESEQYKQAAARSAAQMQRVLIVFGVAWLARLIHVFSLKAAPFFSYKIGDAARYDQWARALADGNWIGEGVFYQAPLYPYFLGLVYSTMGDSVLTVRLVQSLLGATSCVFLMMAATRLFGKKSGLISGLFLALYAPSIFLEGLIQKSTLDLFFLTVLLWLISKTVYRVRVAQWVWIGIVTGALCLTRENALVLLPMFVFWIVFASMKATSPRSPQEPMDRARDPSWVARNDLLCRVQWCLAFGLGLSLTLGPVAMRNYLVGGQFHLTTSQLGPNFYIGNNPEANGTYQPLRPGRGDAQFEQADAVALAEHAAGRELSAREVSQHYLHKSFEFISQQPQQWLKLMIRKVGMTFNRREIIDTEDQYTVAKWSPLLRWSDLVFNFGVLVPLGLLGILVTRQRWQRLWILYLIIAAFAVTVIAFFVFGRYRFPIAPVLMLFVGPAVLSLIRSIRSQRMIQSGSCVIVLAIGLVVCNLNLSSSAASRGITLSNYGVQAMIRSDYRTAEKFLVDAVEDLPNSAVVHNNLGVLYRETGRIQLARDHFELALQLEPADERVRRNLAKNASKD